MASPGVLLDRWHHFNSHSCRSNGRRIKSSFGAQRMASPGVNSTGWHHIHNRNLEQSPNGWHHLKYSKMGCINALQAGIIGRTNTTILIYHHPCKHT
ncbi:Uncharacterized protein TCM_023893 [Theobroma cacao]|uniref:Uncharacterized protein n=1 Tax=Theobroma cacao TaxID=3641 RepID=A0A061EWI5_THECC|nr:Uncharacterized protein TCM_023893 [Theobroma cacao]